MPALPEPLRKKLLALSGAGALALAACYTAFWEGHATRPYADSGGVLTVCYGHTGGDITPGTTKTPAQCEALLAADMRQAFAVIDRQVTVPLSDGQRVERTAEMSHRREAEIRQAYAEEAANAVSEALRGQEGMSHQMESKIRDILLGKAQCIFQQFDFSWKEPM